MRLDWESRSRQSSESPWAVVGVGGSSAPPGQKARSVSTDRGALPCGFGGLECPTPGFRRDEELKHGVELLWPPEDPRGSGTQART